MNKSPCPDENKGIYFAAHSVAMERNLHLNFSKFSNEK